jgi:signal transduction histidine kinase
LVAAFNHWALNVPLAELAVRPMLEDVATYLPPDFEPPQTQRLRTKALLPLPAVLLFAALAVGGYANLSANGPERLSLALAIGTVTVALATIIFFIGARALIEPVDDLIAATQRVRAGDLETPVPIVTGDELGVLSHSFNQMLEGLREREALLEHNTELAEALRGSLTRIVTAAAAERRRVERDLHDGAQQHLVLLKLKLGLLESAAADDPKLIALVREMRDDLAAALAELRDLAHGIYPAALANDGLPGALRDAAGRAGIPATLEADGAGRYSPEVETAVYFCCLEALQNAAKHAGDGATATIRLEAVDGALKFEVADDGVGYEPSKVEDHGGLQNMTDRIGALGGRVWITSKPGQGTVVAGELSVRPVG